MFAVRSDILDILSFQILYTSLLGIARENVILFKSVLV